MSRTGRPPLPPGQAKTVRVVLSLTPTGLELLDALVARDEQAETRQELLSFLIREEAHRRGIQARNKRNQKKGPKA